MEKECELRNNTTFIKWDKNVLRFLLRHKYFTSHLKKEALLITFLSDEACGLHIKSILLQNHTLLSQALIIICEERNRFSVHYC